MLEERKDTDRDIDFREELRTTPEKIDAMMESKHVLSASKLLTSSTKQALSQDMMQIGALDDVRRTLASQKNVKIAA